MKTKRFRHNNMEREYIVFGNGPRILYAFHGFGRSSNDWELFSDWLANDFTVYSFNDFFHGKSEFPLSRIQNDPLTKREISEYFKAFSESIGHDLVSLMAYSSGGRTAFTLVEEASLKIGEIWLFAPDGIKISFWNNLFCKSRLIQTVFRRIVNKPFLFFYLTKALSKMHLLNRSLSSFVLFNMRSKFKREQVYNYWMVYKAIIPSMKSVIKSIEENEIKLHLIFGRKDVVIEPKIGEQLTKKLKGNADVLILEGGHQLIVENHLELLKNRYSGK